MFASAFRAFTIAGALMLPSSVVAQTTVQTTSPSSAVKEFAQQVHREWPGESHQQAVTESSLTHMFAALESLLAPDPGARERFQPELNRLKAATKEYGYGPPGEKIQAKRLRKIFRDASDLIEDVAERLSDDEGNEPSLNALRRAARSLEDDEVLLRQPDVIERFFDHAAAVLIRVESNRAGT
jgi:hypothetical protein